MTRSKRAKKSAYANVEFQTPQGKLVEARGIASDLGVAPAARPRTRIRVAFNPREPERVHNPSVLPGLWQAAQVLVAALAAASIFIVRNVLFG